MCNSTDTLNGAGNQSFTGQKKAEPPRMETSVNIYRLRSFVFFLTQASAALMMYTANDGIFYNKDASNLLAHAISELGGEIDSQLELLETAYITWEENA